MFNSFNKKSISKLQIRFNITQNVVVIQESRMRSKKRRFKQRFHLPMKKLFN